jgi:pimeloyl-ACP methyl ester carboxylesterase
VSAAVVAPVVLVPGLWVPRAAMALLGARLARRGYAVHFFGYSGRRPFEANVERLARFARETLRGSAAHFVGHSLGGVLILETLNRHEDIAARSAVLLGAPVRGSFAGRRFGLKPFGRWMMGGCGPRWDERPASWRRSAPLGVVAGTLPVGLGRAFGALPGDSDGVVCVTETEVAGMVGRALVPVGHSAMVISGRVAALVARFLATGRFE